MPPPSTGLGGGGNSVVRSSRLPLVCARASLADSSNSAKTFWSMTNSLRLSFPFDSFNHRSKHFLLLLRERIVLVLRVCKQQGDPLSVGQPQVMHSRTAPAFPSLSSDRSSVPSGGHLCPGRGPPPSGSPRGPVAVPAERLRAQAAQ